MGRGTNDGVNAKEASTNAQTNWVTLVPVMMRETGFKSSAPLEYVPQRQKLLLERLPLSVQGLLVHFSA